MIAKIKYQDKEYRIDFSKPLDISIPLKDGESNPRAWKVNSPTFEPVKKNEFIGDVSLGGEVNFRNIFFNPHGNGTHTECVGHISKETYTINNCLKTFFFLANVISIFPEKDKGDSVITAEQIKAVWKANHANAIVIRTLPNTSDKLSRQYTGTNPTFMDSSAVQFLINNGIEHLLIDLPSVDKEEDGGSLISHRTFWQYPDNIQKGRTITELIFVPECIHDGLYFLNLQIASFENDASPSKPILYEIKD